MNYLPVIGRILFAAPMLVFGFGHFGAAADMAGMVPSFLPAPTLFVYLTGALLVASGLGIAVGFKARLQELLGSVAGRHVGIRGGNRGQPHGGKC